MTVETAIARAASNTGAGDQDITDASFGGGTPKACIILWNEAITAGTAIDGERSSYGVATGPSNQGCLAWNSEHNDVVSSDSRGTASFDRVINVQAFGGTAVQAAATFVTFITDGIRINWSSAPSIASLMTVILFGGDDFEAHVDNYALGVEDSVVDTTAPGFQPNVVLSLATHVNTSASVQLGVGWTLDDAGSITQHTWNKFSSNGANPTDVSDALQSDAGIALKFRTSTTRWRAVFSDFDANGFTTTVRDGDATNTNHLYLAMRFGGGVKTFMGPYGTAVGVGDDAEVVGFKPQLVMMTFLEEIVAFDTQTRGGTDGFSVFNETDEFCHSSSEEDGVDPTIGGTNTQSLSSAKALDVPDGSGTIEAVATLASFDAGGYTLNYTVVPSPQRAYLQMVIGENPVAAEVTPALINRIRGDEMGAVVQRREFLELTSAASKVMTEPFLVGGNAWEVQFKAPSALCGMEGSNDLQEWDTMTDILGLPIASKNSTTSVGLERPKYLRFFVDIDAGEPQVFSAIIVVQKQAGS